MPSGVVFPLMQWAGRAHFLFVLRQTHEVISFFFFFSYLILSIKVPFLCDLWVLLLRLELPLKGEIGKRGRSKCRIC